MYKRLDYPPPLTREEELATVLRVQSGDAKAREQMILHNMRQVVMLASRYISSRHHLEDLISVGSIGLMKAVDSYNPNLGIRFSTFASRCIVNQILMYFRSQRIHCPASVSLDAMKNDNGEMLEAFIDANDKPIEHQIELEADKVMLKECLKQLNVEQKRIIELRYGAQPCSQAQIAKQMGLSQSYVSRLEKRAINDLRQKFYKEM